MPDNPVPEGRTSLAQRASAGKNGTNDSSPGGTPEFSRYSSGAVAQFRLSSRASVLCAARDLGEPRDASRSLRRNNRASGSHPYRRPPDTHQDSTIRPPRRIHLSPSDEFLPAGRVPRSLRFLQGAGAVDRRASEQTTLNLRSRSACCDALPAITLSSRPEWSHNSVIPTGAKRSGGTLCFRIGAKTSVPFQQAQAGILHQWTVAETVLPRNWKILSS